MDEQLYKNILFLKSYKGSFEELGLFFTVSTNGMLRITSNYITLNMHLLDFGVQNERELIPNGKDILVTEANRLMYIYLIANDHLNNAIRLQSKAFLNGICEVLQPEWLKLFNEVRFATCGILYKSSPLNSGSCKC